MVLKSKVYFKSHEHDENTYELYTIGYFKFGKQSSFAIRDVIKF